MSSAAPSLGSEVLDHGPVCAVVGLLHVIQVVRRFFFGAWESMASSYWLPPTSMALVATGLALGMLALDSAGGDGVRGYFPWIYTGGAEGAREILGAVASSMMTVLSVTFSITIVALTVASQQFGPRVLHNFVRKPGPQVVLGSFISTFIYSLIVLRSVRSDNGSFVPHLSVTVDVALAALSIGALIYFIHHVSSSIQASTIISEISADVERGIDRLFPDCLAGDESEEPREDARLEPRFEDSGAVRARSSGYVQALDDELLLKIARECGLVVRIDRRPGDFVVRGDVLAAVAPGEKVDDQVAGRIRATVVIGPRRTPAQDIRFGLSQLLEITLHALSPSMNEPFLAVNCIDRLIQALARLAERRVPSSRRRDESGALRVIAEPFTFEAAAARVFDSLLPSIGSSPTVSIRLLEGVGAIAPHLRRAQDRTALAAHAFELHAESRRAVPGESLKQRLDAAYQSALDALAAADVR